MHPAPSVIIFNTFSALGFGMLFWLGFDPVPQVSWTAFAFFAVAYIMAVGGLIASTFHLGHPERAIKAFSQWRTSWLSREGICAVAALVVMGLYGLGLVFFYSAWQPLGYIGGLLSIGVIFTTSMIYAQMTTIPRWKHWSTPALYLLLALGGGALFAAEVTIAIVLLILAAVALFVHWTAGDKALEQSGSTLATATQLGGIGKVRAFEPPHTGTNYLLKEFAFEVGRKHAQNLRIIAMGLGFAVPVLALLILPGHFGAAVAVLSHIAGVLALRWLFFAQAEHVVGLYYGKR